ncbi:MAG: hypothetical protein ACXWP5_05480 [Bdellovibrionota bacterium]
MRSILLAGTITLAATFSGCSTMGHGIVSSRDSITIEIQDPESAEQRKAKGILEGILKSYPLQPYFFSDIRLVPGNLAAYPEMTFGIENTKAPKEALRLFLFLQTGYFLNHFNNRFRRWAYNSIREFEPQRGDGTSTDAQDAHKILGEFLTYCALTRMLGSEQGEKIFAHGNSDWTEAILRDHGAIEKIARTNGVLITECRQP